jgi:uncharacterized membrane protein
MQDILLFLALLNSALLTGNEFAVGAFVHPSLKRLAAEPHVLGVQQIGKIYGSVMPFWMASVVLLSGSLLFFASFPSTVWYLYAAATLFFALAIVFSLLGPVPINNQVMGWDAGNLPDNWLESRERWDSLHNIRIAILILGFSCLVGGVLIIR